MDKKYIVLDQYDVSEKEYNQVFSTEQEAIDKATENLQSSNRTSQYVAVVTKEIASDLEPVTVIVKSI